jgi:hypothetical protein
VPETVFLFPSGRAENKGRIDSLSTGANKILKAIIKIA